jgi:hypothetical protein
MDIHEGLRRINLIAKGIMMFGPALGVLYWASYYFAFGHESLFELFLVIAAPIVLGGGLRLVTWIVAGFASPPRATQMNSSN